MHRILFAILAAVSFATSAFAQPAPFPKGFRTQEIAANGATLHVRIGGQGPAVVLLHGYGETGDMWAPLAADLARDHRVIVPDLRGLGLSSRPAGGYDKKTQAGDIAGVLDALEIDRVDLVTHDIGNMVGFAFAAQHPERVTGFVIMDAPVPGVGPWEEVLKNPLLWHFHFGGPDAERLVAGRERIYLDRFWNEFSADPRKFGEGSRRHYAELYARPGAMHAGFAQFAAFDQDAVDNRAFLAHGRLTIPVLAVGGEKSFGSMQAFIMRFAADDVTEAVIADSGHWLMEEQPSATVAAVRGFFDAHSRARRIAARQLTPEAIDALAREGAGAGTSGVSGITTAKLIGDPAEPGPYAIEIRVPAHTQIAAHTHRDDRLAIVVSGVWNFGYGEKVDAAKVEVLAPGGFYTEPAGEPHFAFTAAEPATVYVTGYGPTDTHYAEAASEPRQP
jgi:pimeloyl-ACP methyl ester carboxylesterase/quercetin dioxygenase-like cupin family protein